MNNRQTVQQSIRLSIQGMVANHDDHTFEKMCYDYTFYKICDNIVFPTGGGCGDKGRDFYTIPIYQNGIKSKEIAFLCSLNKKFEDKIKSDLQSLCNNFPEIQNAYFYAGVDIPESKRYKLITYAKENHNIELIIIDLNQLSQLLSNIKNYDIVDNYLHLPSSIYPRPEEANWYINFYQKYQDNLVVSFENFREVVAALRETQLNPDLRIDTKFWIDKIKNFYNNSQDFYSKSRALYEIAYSNLRILNNLNDFKDNFINYANSFENTDNLIIIEDAICILNYACGTIVEGITYPDNLISNFYNKIKNILINLLKISNNINKARLIYLNILLSIKSTVIEQNNGTYLVEQIENMLTEMETYPFFSASKVDKAIKIFLQKPVREKLKISECKAIEIQNRIDKLISRQEGDGILGERIRDRMLSHINNNNYMDAIREGHKLKKAWNQQDSYYGCILSLAILAFSYEKLGLYYAAKYYYLISIRMCIFSDDPYLFSKVMKPIYSLTKLEYKLGNWFNFFKLLDTYFSIYYLTERKELELADEESQELIYYSCIIKRTTSFDSKYDNLINDIIKNLNCDNNLKHSILVDFQQDSIYPDLGNLWKDLQKSISNRPFSDININNTIIFNTSGIEWLISYKNENNNHIIVEEFAAILQIILAEMQGQDIMHIKTKIDINIIQSSSFELEELPDNECFKYKISIPGYNIEFDINEFILQVLSCCFTIIEKCSLLEKKYMLNILEQLFKNDLMDRLCFFSSYRNSYSRLYEIKDNYKTKNLDIFNKNEKYNPDSKIIDIFKYNETSQLFNETETKNVIQRRYVNSYEFLEPTLNILRKSKIFKEQIIEYQQKGYLDWELLMALSNILLDYKAKEEINQYQLIYTEEQKYKLYNSIINKIVKNRTKNNTPPKNLNIFFDKDIIDIHLKMNYTIELKRLGLNLKTQTPKFNAIKDFLNTRFNYNYIDVPHKNII